MGMYIERDTQLIDFLDSNFDMQEYGAWPEYKRRKAPEFE